MKNKPECYVPSREYPELYSGVPAFLGLPVVKDAADVKNYDIIFKGMPWEGICTYGGFTGVENATKKIREASVRYGGYLPEYKIDIFDYFTGADYGDIAVQNGNREFTFSQVENYMREMSKTDAITVNFGGDHSLTYPSLKAFAEKYDGNIGVIHFDAHMDNMDNYGEEKFARCSPFHRVYEIEGFNPKNIVHVGIRGPRNNWRALDEAAKFGATVITSFDIFEKGVIESIREAIKIASEGTKAVYVTVCSDILDVSCNPGGPTDFCGMSAYDLARMLYECGYAGAKAFDFMEIYPPQDANNISAHGACWQTLYFLAGAAQRKKELDEKKG